MEKGRKRAAGWLLLSKKMYVKGDINQVINIEMKAKVSPRRTMGAFMG